MGTGSIAAQLMGKEDMKQADEYASSAILMGVVSGLAVTILGLKNLDWLIWEMGATATIFPYAKDYAKYILLGAPFMILSFILNNLMRWQGKAHRSAIGMGFGGVLNMVLDPIFIFVLDMGIAGAAIATILSQFVSFSILTAFFIRGESDLKLRVNLISRRPAVYWNIFKSGMPSFLRQGVAGIATMALNRAAYPYGDAAVAAMAIVTKVFMFINSAIIGFGQGFQPVVGYNYGAGKLDRVKEAVKFSMKTCTVVLSIAAVVGFFFAPEIVLFFRDDPAVVEIGVNAFRFQCISMPFGAVLVFANMLFQSMGCSWRAAFLAICKQGFCFIPVVLILTQKLGVTGLEMSQMIADLITAAISGAALLQFFLCEFGKKKT
jgi:putative MATE family efflux protein